VKTGGKSTRLYRVIYIVGKPYREQGKTACLVIRSVCMRVCRIDRWLSGSKMYARILLYHKIRLIDCHACFFMANYFYS